VTIVVTSQSEQQPLALCCVSNVAREVLSPVLVVALWALRPAEGSI
jgi:hypothetical protein